MGFRAFGLACLKNLLPGAAEHRKSRPTSNHRLHLDNRAELILPKILITSTYLLHDVNSRSNWANQTFHRLSPSTLNPCSPNSKPRNGAAEVGQNLACCVCRARIPCGIEIFRGQSILCSICIHILDIYVYTRRYIDMYRWGN